MPRQTNLSLAELVSILDNANTCGGSGPDEIPDGLLVNEIGEIFWDSGPESVAAEEKLVELTRQGVGGIHLVAFRYLSDERAPRKTNAALEAINYYAARKGC